MKSEKIKKNNSLAKDLFISFIFGIITFIASYYGFMQVVGSTQLNLFITIFITMIGFLATILTLLFTFEQIFANNTVILALKSRGIYDQLYTRFISSVLSLFYITVIFVILSLSNLLNPEASILSSSLILILSSFIYFLTAFGFIEIYKPLSLFRNLQEAIILYQNQQKNKK